MKRTTPWIVALACLTTIGGSLWAASEMNLAPWAAPAPAPVPKQLTVTGSPTDSIADAGATFTLNIQSDTAWTVTSGPDTWITFDNTTGPKGTTARSSHSLPTPTASPRWGGIGSSSNLGALSPGKSTLYAEGNFRICAAKFLYIRK